MEVLDKIDAASFGMQDMEIMGLFAQQAALAIEQSQQMEEIGDALLHGLKQLAAAEGLPDSSRSGPGPGRRTPHGIADRRPVRHRRPVQRPEQPWSQRAPGGAQDTDRLRRTQPITPPFRLSANRSSMSSEQLRPAWSEQFTPEAIREIISYGPLAAITPEWAWGGSTGKGVNVAVVDTGIEADHPLLGNSVKGGVVIEFDEDAPSRATAPLTTTRPVDLAGHGTACAGIIHSIAPEAELYSVRVLGRNMSGRAYVFAGGLDWAIEHDMDVVNLSLSTGKEDYFALFHDLADQAVFKNIAARVGRQQHSRPPATRPPSRRSSPWPPTTTRPVQVLLQPQSAGGVWRAGHRRRSGLDQQAGGDQHRQQLRRAPHRGHHRPHSGQAPRT